jgi:hypothetical protein
MERMGQRYCAPTMSDLYQYHAVNQLTHACKPEHCQLLGGVDVDSGIIMWGVRVFVCTNGEMSSVSLTNNHTYVPPRPTTPTRR